MLVIGRVVLVREERNPAGCAFIIIDQDETVVLSDSILSPVNDHVSNVDLYRGSYGIHLFIR